MESPGAMFEPSNKITDKLGGAGGGVLLTIVQSSLGLIIHKFLYSWVVGGSWIDNSCQLETFPIKEASLKQLKSSSNDEH